LGDSPIDDDWPTLAIGSVEFADDVLKSPILGDRSGGDRPLFNHDFETLFPVWQPSNTVPLPAVLRSLDLNGKCLSPLTASLDKSAFKSLRVQSKKHRKTAATGTRIIINPESLAPIDDPAQPRKYLMLSATSRKEVPLVFEGDEEHQPLEDGRQYAEADYQM
jgi:hypothetical protein